MNNQIFTIIQPPTSTEPIGNPPIWDAAMNRSGGRCECTGACGRRHSKSEFRCDRTHDRGRVRLLVAPADLSLTPQQAARLTLPDLLHWCPDCHQAARRRHTAAAAIAARLQGRQAPAPEALF